MHDDGQLADPAGGWRFGAALELAVRFATPLAYAAAVPLPHRLQPLAPLLLVAILPLVLLAAEALPQSRRARLPRGGFLINRLAIWLTIVAELALILWGAVTAATEDAAGIAALAVTIGIGCGVFGMLAAHEMIHSRNRSENALGEIMLTAMTYRHFRISHLFGHHRWAATARDPATARRGEGAYAFLWRSILCQLTDAYRFERKRLGHGVSAVARNRVVRGFLLYPLIYLSLDAALGWRAALFQAAQSVVAIVVLELFNYVAHYGLVRGTLPGGRREPLSDLHSWNAKCEVGNWLLLDMGHHSDHHRIPSQSHSLLSPINETPVLPGGYAGAIFIALVPPLWRHLMDGRTERWQTLRATP